MRAKPEHCTQDTALLVVAGPPFIRPALPLTFLIKAETCSVD
jgi:hypothetical protein